MAKAVILRWSGYALSDVNAIAVYLHKEGLSREFINTFIDRLFDAGEAIGKNPLVYPEMPELKSKRRMYRSKLFSPYYKFIFRIRKHEVLILRVVGTRQNPKQLRTLRGIR